MDNNYKNGKEMGSGGYKKSIWQWVMIYIIIGAVIYGGVYYFMSKRGGYNYGQSANQSPTQPQAMAPTGSVANLIYMSKSSPAKGNYMADPQGMTLYTFDKDTAGVSNCYDACAVAWPVYAPGASSQSQLPANVTVIQRTDGTNQFAWKNMPLYYYAKDKAVGDIVGDGVGGVWHIVKL